MGTFGYDKAKMLAKADDIKTIGADVLKKMELIYNKYEIDMKAVWQGPNYEALGVQVRKQKEDFIALGQKIENEVARLTTTASQNYL